MTDNHTEQYVPRKLTEESLRIPLEQYVSKFTGRRWMVKVFTDLADYACHPAAILSDGTFAVFAKFSEAINGLEQFEIEVASLRFLAQPGGVLIPTPIGIIPVEGGTILVLEAVQQVDRSNHHWRRLGQTLAKLHKVKADRFGLETHGYFGPIYQDNTSKSNWVEFYAECRLLPGMKLANESGNLPFDVAKKLERIINRLPELCGPDVVPSLLHGDAQQNNFICTEAGEVVIDPAIYFGHPEIDLATVDFFQPVPQDVFDGYQEELPIAPGFLERRSLWRIWGYLACVTVGGAGYLEKLTGAIHEYK